jgi:predicted 3-demethylubiquinone-9 3-methyltransferase (glyoxalase superfamily)
MNETSNLFNSLAVVARDCNGRIKDLRFVTSKFGKTWQFIPNNLYKRLVNSGDIAPLEFKIPFIFGSWSVINA